MSCPQKNYTEKFGLFGLRDVADFISIDDEIFSINCFNRGADPEIANSCIEQLLNYLVKLRLSAAAASHVFRLLVLAVDDAFLFMQKGNYYYAEFMEPIEGQIKNMYIILEHEFLDSRKSILKLSISVADGEIPDRDSVS